MKWVTTPRLWLVLIWLWHAKHIGETERLVYTGIITGKCSSTWYHHYGQFEGSFRRSWARFTGTWRYIRVKGEIRSAQLYQYWRRYNCTNLDLPLLALSYAIKTPTACQQVKSHRVVICQATLILFSWYTIPLTTLLCMFTNMKSRNSRPTNYTSRSHKILATNPGEQTLTLNRNKPFTHFDRLPLRYKMISFETFPHMIHM